MSKPLSEVQAGDEVAVIEHGVRRIVKIRVVERATRLFIHADGRKFNRDGLTVPRAQRFWYSPDLKQVTTELRKEALYQELADRIGRIKWREQSLDTLKAVAAALDAAKGEGE